MSLIFIFCLFFIWSYILYNIAEFFIYNRLKFDSVSVLQVILHTACAFSFLSLWLTSLPQYPLFFILSSALWITIFTDLQHMLISRFVTLYLSPIGFLANYYELLPVTALESFFASISTASILIIINWMFKKIKNYDGLGQGDIDLMLCIGAWLGCIGAWFTILIGSTIGTISCLLYMLYSRKTISMIPFGPFLALGSLIFMIFNKEIINFFVC